MSAPLAGKFQDHYELLGVDPRAGSDSIQDAYAKLAKKSKEDGDPEKLESLNLAYEVLIDPVLRRAFDKIKGIGEDTGGPKFSGLGFFDSFGKDIYLRQALLCILYDRRRKRPATPSVSVRNLESMLEAKSEELVLSLWYLKARGFVANDDKSSVLITVDGIDTLEKHLPDASRVMPLIKTSALEGPAPERAAQTVSALPEPDSAEEASAAPEGSLSILRRVLARV